MIENHNGRNGEYNFNDDTGHYDWLEKTGILYQGDWEGVPAWLLADKPGSVYQFTHVSIWKIGIAKKIVNVGVEMRGADIFYVLKAKFLIMI